MNRKDDSNDISNLFQRIGLPIELEAVYRRKGLHHVYDWQRLALTTTSVIHNHMNNNTTNTTDSRISSSNLVYCAPTSSGKTLVAELVLLRTALIRKKQVLFVLPYVSLVVEKERSLKQILAAFYRRVESKNGTTNAVQSAIGSDNNINKDGNWDEDDEILDEHQINGYGRVSVKAYYGDKGGGGRSYREDIIICTIERANIIINTLISRGRINSLGLVVLDETHVLGSEMNGSLLEILLSKILYGRSIRNSPHTSTAVTGPPNRSLETFPSIQLVAMSATVGNIETLASWLQAELYVTDFRPVPLSEYIKAGPEVFSPDGQLLRRLEGESVPGGVSDEDVNQAKITISRTTAEAKRLKNGGSTAAAAAAVAEMEEAKKRLTNLLAAQQRDPDGIGALVNEGLNSGQQVIVFCPTKAMCVSVCTMLAETLAGVTHRKDLSPNEVEALMTQRQQLVEDLQSTHSHMDGVLCVGMSCGMAYHHSGLLTSERQAVESSFSSGLISVLIATTTLAAGVNLPAGRVIIRSLTLGRSALGIVNYRQMTGRAGRAGQTAYGESFLVVRPFEKSRAFDLVRQSLPPIESQFHPERDGGNALLKAIIETIGLGLCRRVDDVVQFVRHTLLYFQAPDISVRDALEEMACLAVSFLAEGSVVNIGPGISIGRGHDMPNNNSDGGESLRPTDTLTITKFGQALLKSGLDPAEGVALYSSLLSAEEYLCLETPLHLLFLVAPLEHSLQPNFAVLLSLYEKSLKEKTSLHQLFDSLGVSMRWLHQWQIQPPSRLEVSNCSNQLKTDGLSACLQRILLRKSAQSSNSHTVPNAGPSRAKKMEWKVLCDAKRLWAALALQAWMDGYSADQIAMQFNTEGPAVEALQRSAMIQSIKVRRFCLAMGWTALEKILEAFRDELSIDAPKELRHLLRVPRLPRRVARVLVNAGITRAEQLLGCHPVAVAQHLQLSIGFELGCDDSLNSDGPIMLVDTVENKGEVTSREGEVTSSITTMDSMVGNEENSSSTSLAPEGGTTPVLTRDEVIHRRLLLMATDLIESARQYLRDCGYTEEALHSLACSEWDSTGGGDMDGLLQLDEEEKDDSEDEIYSDDSIAAANAAEEADLAAIDSEEWDSDDLAEEFAAPNYGDELPVVLPHVPLVPIPETHHGLDMRENNELVVAPITSRMDESRVAEDENSQKKGICALEYEPSIAVEQIEEFFVAQQPWQQSILEDSYNIRDEATIGTNYNLQSDLFEKQFSRTSSESRKGIFSAVMNGSALNGEYNNETKRRRIDESFISSTILKSSDLILQSPFKVPENQSYVEDNEGGKEEVPRLYAVSMTPLRRSGISRCSTISPFGNGNSVGPKEEKMMIVSNAELVEMIEQLESAGMVHEAQEAQTFIDVLPSVGKSSSPFHSTSTRSTLSNSSNRTPELHKGCTTSNVSSESKPRVFEFYPLAQTTTSETGLGTNRVGLNGLPTPQRSLVRQQSVLGRAVSASLHRAVTIRIEPLTEQDPTFTSPVSSKPSVENNQFHPGIATMREEGMEDTETVAYKYERWVAREDAEEDEALAALQGSDEEVSLNIRSTVYIPEDEQDAANDDSDDSIDRLTAPILQPDVEQSSVIQNDNMVSNNEAKLQRVCSNRSVASPLTRAMGDGSFAQQIFELVDRAEQFAASQRQLTPTSSTAIVNFHNPISSETVPHTIDGQSTTIWNMDIEKETLFGARPSSGCSVTPQAQSKSISSVQAQAQAAAEAAFYGQTTPSSHLLPSPYRSPFAALQSVVKPTIYNKIISGDDSTISEAIKSDTNEDVTEALGMDLAACMLAHRTCRLMADELTMLHLATRCFSGGSTAPLGVPLIAPFSLDKSVGSKNVDLVRLVSSTRDVLDLFVLLSSLPSFSVELVFRPLPHTFLVSSTDEDDQTSGLMGKPSFESLPPTEFSQLATTTHLQRVPSITQSLDYKTVNSEAEAERISLSGVPSSTWADLLSIHCHRHFDITCTDADAVLHPILRIEEPDATTALKGGVLVAVALNFGAAESFVLRLPIPIPVRRFSSNKNNYSSKRAMKTTNLTLDDMPDRVARRICTFVGFVGLLTKCSPMAKILRRAMPSPQSGTSHYNLKSILSDGLNIGASLLELEEKGSFTMYEETGNPLLMVSKRWCSIARNTLYHEWRRGGAIEWRFLSLILADETRAKVGSSWANKLTQLRERDLLVGGTLLDPRVAYSLLTAVSGPGQPPQQPHGSTAKIPETPPPPRLPSIEELLTALSLDCLSQPPPISDLKTSFLHRAYYLAAHRALLSMRCMAELELRLNDLQLLEHYHTTEAPALELSSDLIFCGLEIDLDAMSTLRTVLEDRRVIIRQFFTRLLGQRWSPTIPGDVSAAEARIRAVIRKSRLERRPMENDKKHRLGWYGGVKSSLEWEDEMEIGFHGDYVFSPPTAENSRMFGEPPTNIHNQATAALSATELEAAEEALAITAHPLSRLIHEFRAGTSHLATIETVLRHRRQNRIRCSIAVVGTDTGRLIITDPPLQHIPKAVITMPSRRATLADEIAQVRLASDPHETESTHTHRLLIHLNQVLLSTSDKSSSGQNHRINEDMARQVWVRVLCAFAHTPIGGTEEILDSSLIDTLGRIVEFVPTSSSNQNAEDDFLVRTAPIAAKIDFSATSLLPAVHNRQIHTSKYMHDMNNHVIDNPDIRIVPLDSVCRVNASLLPPPWEVFFVSRCLSSSDWTSELASAYGRESTNAATIVNMRRCFVASDNFVFVSADFRQAELRILTHFSREPILLDVFEKRSDDVFKLLAASWLVKPAFTVTGDERDSAKRLAYAAIYGAGPAAVAEQCGLPNAEAGAALLESFFAALPVLTAFLAAFKERVAATGVVTTLLGRKRYLPRLNSRSLALKSRGERQAVNTLCQGSAADLTKRAMARVTAALCELSSKSRRTSSTVDSRPPFFFHAFRSHPGAGLYRRMDDARLVLQMHDELIFEVRADYQNEMASILRDAMEGAAELAIPLEVKVKIGRSWGDLEEWNQT